jgi:hypothetical protein
MERIGEHQGQGAGVRGMPVGCNQPIFQLVKMHRNSTMEMPTLKAKARIMRLVLGVPSASPRIMNKNAVAKATSTVTNAIAINIFMSPIIQ